jgi:hypothetical protein
VLQLSIISVARARFAGNVSRPSRRARLGVGPLLLLATLGGACVPPTPGIYRHEMAQRRLSPLYPPLDTAEYAPFAAGGTGRIEGRVECEASKGGFHPMTERPVVLDPVTSFSRVWYDCIGSNNTFGLDVVPPDPRAVAQRHVVMTDEHGSFVFAGLAPGRYFVLSMVSADECVLGKVRVKTVRGPKVGREVAVIAGETTSADLCDGRACAHWTRPGPLLWAPDVCYAAPLPPCSYGNWLFQGCGYEPARSPLPTTTEPSRPKDHA